MKITLNVEIEDPEVELENYQNADRPIKTLQEAVEFDLELFKSGEVALEDVIYNYNGDVTVSVASVQYDNQEDKK